MSVTDQSSDSPQEDKRCQRSAADALVEISDIEEDQNGHMHQTFGNLCG